ncbi:hypothetical protein NP233_g1544 [Leucocoprinus birnbaumii]|uniref:Uncharacterized protein n=1 Tax=Leucocoprinus birnbaumii TaxID=56174 RepID=A0AAD5W5H2_9AGAR|nr:hypothetical protein NP233_g1544 [Leucocoprinus birnbaumii]
MNNDDNESFTRSAPLHSSMNQVRQDLSGPLDPFAKIIRDSQMSTHRPSGRLNEGISRKGQSQENQFQTPKRKSRPFQTPKREKGSVLGPYANLLRGSGAHAMPVHHSPRPSFNFQRPTTPQQLSSSPVQAQEQDQDQWADRGAISATPSQEKPRQLDASAMDEDALEILKRANKDVFEKGKQIEGLQYQVIALKKERSAMMREYTQMSQELETMRAKMGDNSARMSSVQSQVERCEAAMQAKNQELEKAVEIAKVKEEENLQLMEKLEQVSSQAEEIRSAYNQEVAKGEGLAKKVLDANRRIEELDKAHNMLEKGLDDLQASCNSHRRGASEALKDLSQVKDLASSALDGIASSGTQRLLSEAKTALAELKDDLLESHRVNDLYRDKLRVATSQLADTMIRLRELENEKREVWTQTLERASENSKLREALVASEEKATKALVDLRSLEQHGLELLTQSAELEAKMNEVDKRNEELSAEVAVLRPLQQQKLQLQTELADLARRLSEETASRTRFQAQATETKDALINTEKEVFILRTQREDAMNSRTEAASELSSLKIAFKELEASLSSIQEAARIRERDVLAQYEAQISGFKETIHKWEQEAALLKSRLEFDETQREQLRASLSQEQATTTLLQHQLKETGVRELIAAGKVDMHEARIASLIKEVTSKDEQICVLNAKLMSAQDRYEIQASTLRLTKEELGDMHEKYANAIKNAQTSEMGFATEMAAVREQNTFLSAELEKTHRTTKAQEDSALKRTSELQAVIQALQLEVQRLSDAKIDYENAMKREAAHWKEQEEEYRSKMLGMQGMIDILKAAAEEETSRAVNKAVALEKKAISGLEAHIKALVHEKGETLERQRTFRERYQAGTLSDTEKDLISSLLQDAEALHEQAAVAKDNEMKRRDAIISTLQARIGELEALLVEAFHPVEDAPDLSSILNLKISPAPTAPGEPVIQHPASPAVSGTLPPVDVVMAPAPVDVERDIGTLIPLASQMPSELSTPPQSPLASKAKVSFVHLSKDDDDDDEATNNPPPPPSPPRLPEKSTIKRKAEIAPAKEGAPTKKRLRANAGKKGNQEGNAGQASEMTAKPKQKRKKATV